MDGQTAQLDNLIMTKQMHQFLTEDVFVPFLLLNVF